MAEIIANYSVSSSNSSKSQQGTVTVRNLSGEIVSRIRTARSNPLGFLRKWPLCPERLELESKLANAGVPANVIEQILMPRKNT